MEKGTTMKKIIVAAIAAVSMLATPVAARDNYRYHSSHRGNNTGAVIAGIIGGVVLGTVISESGRDRRYEDRRDYRDDDRYYRGYREPRYVVVDPYGSNVYERRCQEIRRVDYYGNPYYVTQCF